MPFKFGQIIFGHLCYTLYTYIYIPLIIYYVNFILIVDTATLIKRDIARNHTALVVNEYESILLLSNPNIVNSIKIESPSSEIQWSHNGMFLQEQPHRLKIQDYNIGIKCIIFICNNQLIKLMTLLLLLLRISKYKTHS